MIRILPSAPGPKAVRAALPVRGSAAFETALDRAKARSSERGPRTGATRDVKERRRTHRPIRRSKPSRALHHRSSRGDKVSSPTSLRRGHEGEGAPKAAAWSSPPDSLLRAPEPSRGRLLPVAEPRPQARPGPVSERAKDAPAGETYGAVKLKEGAGKSSASASKVALLRAKEVRNRALPRPVGRLSLPAPRGKMGGRPAVPASASADRRAAPELSTRGGGAGSRESVSAPIRTGGDIPAGAKAAGGVRGARVFLALPGRFGRGGRQAPGTSLRSRPVGPFRPSPKRDAMKVGTPRPATSDGAVPESVRRKRAASRGAIRGSRRSDGPPGPSPTGTAARGVAPPEGAAFNAAASGARMSRSVPARVAILARPKAVDANVGAKVLPDRVWRITRAVRAGPGGSPVFAVRPPPRDPISPFRVEVHGTLGPRAVVRVRFAGMVPEALSGSGIHTLGQALGGHAGRVEVSGANGFAASTAAPGGSHAGFGGGGESALEGYRSPYQAAAEAATGSSPPERFWGEGAGIDFRA